MGGDAFIHGEMPVLKGPQLFSSPVRAKSTAGPHTMTLPNLVYFTKLFAECGWRVCVGGGHGGLGKGGRHMVGWAEVAPELLLFNVGKHLSASDPTTVI